VAETVAENFIKEKGTLCMKKREYTVEIINLSVTTKPKCGDTVFVVDRRTSLGNKFNMKDFGGDRDLVCDLYEEWFLSEEFPQKAWDFLFKILEFLQKNGWVALGCHCAPLRCHCETIRKWLLDNV
jgi:hypothetical protein